MGLFDYVKCNYSLPGTPPPCAATVSYQTQDLSCSLSHYTITQDGRLIDDSGREDRSHITATIDLVWSNVVAYGPGIYTANGEDALYLGYRVVFVDGKVTRIEETENRSERAAPRSLLDKSRSSQEVERHRERIAESLLGRTLAVCQGSDLAKAYPATVIAENDTQLVVCKEDGKFVILQRASRDSTFFDSYEDAKAQNDRRDAEWQSQKEEYERTTGKVSE
jgi:hypothetical protein